MRVITEQEFSTAARQALQNITCNGVTGPGRSGAIAAVYASYFLGVPFVSYGQPFPGKLLVVDTVSQSGKTIRKAARKSQDLAPDVEAITIYSQQERLHFWYEDQRL